MTPFVHLHCHSDFSLLDGASSVDALAAKAKSLGMQRLALTDHGNMFGSLAFYKECKAQGVIPIIGSEFYKAPGGRSEKSGSEKGTRHHHLVLLARNMTGYKNLLVLELPRLHRRLLLQAAHRRRAPGAPPRGHHLPERLPGRRHPGRDPRRSAREARSRAQYYRELFGPDGFYLEMQDHGIPEQAVVNKEIVKISRETGIPLVATNDIHYTEREDARAQDVLICIGTGKKVSEGKRMKFEHPEFYFKSGDEMARRFAETPEAVANTVKIGEACNVDLPALRPQFPVYEVPAGHTPDGYLTELARAGLAERFTAVPARRRRSALEFELSIITSMGFTGYFLIVWDFIHYAKENGIAGGPRPRLGRGIARGLQPEDHRHRPPEVRPSLREVPQSRARLDARLRHRLLPPAAGRGHLLRHAASTARTRSARSSRSAP